MANNALSLKDMRHRVKLCTQADVISSDGDLSLVRSEIVQVWADIQAKASQMFSNFGGFAIKEKSTQTHVIRMRYRRDIDITQMAWVYEERLQSAPRWYKILSVKDNDDVWVFSCRLYQASDEAVAPSQDIMPGSAVPLPPGVNL